MGMTLMGESSLDARQNSREVTAEDIGSNRRALQVLTGIAWDNIAVSYPSATQEVFYYTVEGSQTGTMTIDYEDETKEVMTNIART